MANTPSRHRGLVTVPALGFSQAQEICIGQTNKLGDELRLNGAVTETVTTLDTEDLRPYPV